MEMNNINTQISVPYNTNYTPIQLKLPLVFDELVKFDDPVHTFVTIMNEVDLRKYLVSNTPKRGRKGYNPVTMLKVVLFAFQLKGYASTREIEDLCHNDIRFRYLLEYEKSLPTHMTISNFINNYLKSNIEDIFKDINNVIFEKDKVDLNHTYIDGTKFEANANKYSWVWKNACITNQDKLYIKITKLLNELNNNFLYDNTYYEIKDKYEIEYLESIKNDYKIKSKVDINSFVYGKGVRKTDTQRYYELLNEYLNKLKEYHIKIDICGKHRNSYSKTDLDATFMRIKTDYMGNDQLLPAYNLQYCVCDEYIACLDVNQYATDSSCFVPLMNKYDSMYGFYPKYPVADAGYGTYNNYLFCEEKGMEKYMKFSNYKKETKNKK